MEGKRDIKEFEILGHKVKLKDEETETVSAQDVVEVVQQEIQAIKSKAGNLSNSEVALLVALQLAKENLECRKSYATEITELKAKAKQAFDLIDEITPTTM